MDDLTGFQRDLLVVTAGLDDPNGLDVMAELEDYYGTQINHGRLYPNLDSLVDDGLIEKEALDERTNVYRLTAAGREVLADRRAWEDQYHDQLYDDGEESVLAN